MYIYICIFPFVRRSYPACQKVRRLQHLLMGGGSWHEGWGPVGERTAPSKHIPQRTAPLKVFFKRFVFVYFCLGNL